MWKTMLSRMQLYLLRLQKFNMGLKLSIGRNQIMEILELI